MGLLCHSEKELSGQLIETDMYVAQSCLRCMGLNGILLFLVLKFMVVLSAVYLPSAVGGG